MRVSKSLKSSLRLLLCSGEIPVDKCFLSGFEFDFWIARTGAAQKRCEGQEYDREWTNSTATSRGLRGGGHPESADARF